VGEKNIAASGTDGGPMEQSKKKPKRGTEQISVKRNLSIRQFPETPYKPNGELKGGAPGGRLRGSSLAGSKVEKNKSADQA